MSDTRAEIALTFRSNLMSLPEDWNRRSTEQAAPPAFFSEEDSTPLVVDLDGTLIRSDLLVESGFRLIALNPLNLIRLPLWLREGKAGFKARIADHAVLDLHTLPLNEDLVAFIKAERARGRKVYLATAADRRPAEDLARHLGLFDGVFASDGAVNLGGSNKARLLCERFGEHGFDYAGDAKVDLAVWEKAREGILVNASPKLLRAARRRCGRIREIAPRPGPKARGRSALRAMRLHQWLKNLLVFLPLLAGHAFNLPTVGAALLAFLAFGLCASSVYLLNDLLDLPNDRAHPTKRHRPFASGAVPLLHGLALVPLLLAGSVILAAFLPWAFIAVLAGYYALTLAYSLALKRLMVVDVLVLGGLYTVRVMAGAAATGIAVSPWLLVFSMFLFLYLALVKRQTELVGSLRENRKSLAGRGYHTEDLSVLEGLAAASGFLSVLVLALYITSPDVFRLYHRPEALWGVIPLLVYWISRTLILAHRGEMHDDPVVFAATDRVSLVTVGLVLAVAVGAALS